MEFRNRFWSLERPHGLQRGWPMVPVSSVSCHCRGDLSTTGHRMIAGPVISATMLAIALWFRFVGYENRADDVSSGIPS